MLTACIEDTTKANTPFLSVIDRRKTNQLLSETERIILQEMPSEPGDSQVS